MSKYINYGNPPWPLVLKFAWSGETAWSKAAKKEMEKRFPNGMYKNWLLRALEWSSVNIIHD